MLFRDRSGDEIQAVRRRVSLRAREVLAGFIATRAEDNIPRDDQIQPTAGLLTSGLAGLALWWIDHPELDKSVLVDVAARGRAGSAGNRAQPVGVNRSARPRNVGSPPGGASMVTSVASVFSST